MNVTHPQYTFHIFPFFKVLNRPTITRLLRIEQVRGEDIKRLLFIGVGCQVQALRSVEDDLGLDELYVLWTNCVDNPRTSEAGSHGPVRAGVCS